MSLDLVGLPCEIRFKIFDHVSVADLTKWLKIQKLRDSILAFLEDEGKVFLFRKNFMVRHGLDLYRKLWPKSLKRSQSFTDSPPLRTTRAAVDRGGLDLKGGQLKEKP